MHINREQLKSKEQEATKKEQTIDQAPSDSVLSTPKETRSRSNTDKSKNRKRIASKYIWLIALLAVILVATCFKIYMDNSYKPQEHGEEIDDSSLNIELTDNMLVVRNPKRGELQHKIGIIFYQDNRIDGECYLPLMKKMALLGYDCFLPVALGNQAYLNVEGAESVIRKYVSINTWVMVGHSSSCYPASQYTAEKPDKVQGLIFLGGYSGFDLSDSSVAALSILGSNDTLVNRNSYDQSKVLLPKDAVFETIEGANNSGFVDTSLIFGDSESSLSFDEQTDKTTEIIHDFLKSRLDEQ